MKRFFGALIFACLFCSGHSEPDSTEPLPCQNETAFHFVPTVYDIKLLLDYGQRAFRGEVSISGSVDEATQSLRLHSAVNVTDAVLTSGGEKMTIEEIHQAKKERILTLEIVEEMIPGNEYNLWLEFNGEIRTMRGVFGSSYYVDGEERYFIATELQSDYARHVFPCVDDPSFKAHFILNISRHENHTAISNMPCVETSPPDENGQVWDSFEMTPLMSTYTLAFVVGDFERLGSSEGNGIWSLRDGRQRKADYANKLVPKFVRLMENLTEIPYLLPKLDHIGLPKHNSGAMENWGAITYKEEMLLLDDETSSIQKKLSTTFSLAHEIAHQWFGNLVTCRSWLFTWLNEGITSYIHFVLTSKLFPSWDAKGLLLSEEGLTILEDEGYAATSLTKKGCNVEEANTFSMSTYYKGAALMRMVDYLITEESLIDSLKTYLFENSFKTVDEDDLWSQMEDAARSILPDAVNFTTIMKTWTNNNGYPLLNVERNDDGSVTVCQERFEYFATKLPKQGWWIPITYTTSKSPDFFDTRVKGWLGPDTDCTLLDIGLDDDEWIIFNVKQAGFYRVNYDETNWYLIIDALKANPFVIDPINRAQLLDDALGLIKLKNASFETALLLTTYLKEETEYYPWSAAITRFNELYGVLNLGFTDGALQYFKKYLLNLIENVYKLIPTGNDTNEIDSEPLSRLFNYKMIGFACLLQHSDCERRALETIKLLQSGDRNHLRMIRDVRIPLMCTMVRIGNETIFNYAVEELKRETRGEIHNKLLSALYCTKEKQLLKRFIRNVFENSNYIENTDIVELINMANGNDYNVIVETLEEIAEKNSSRVVEMSAALDQLSDIGYLPLVSKTKLKILIESHKEDLPDWGQLLSNLGQPSRPWSLTRKIKDWLARELGASNAIEGRSLDSLDTYDTGDMTLYNSWEDRRSHQGSSKERQRGDNDEKKNASPSNKSSSCSTLIFLFIYFIII